MTGDRNLTVPPYTEVTIELDLVSTPVKSLSIIQNETKVIQQFPLYKAIPSAMKKWPFNRGGLS